MSDVNPVSDQVSAGLGHLPDDRFLRLVGPLPPHDDRLRLREGRGGEGRVPGRPGGEDWSQRVCCWYPRSVRGSDNGCDSELI